MTEEEAKRKACEIVEANILDVGGEPEVWFDELREAISSALLEASKPKAPPP